MRCAGRLAAATIAVALAPTLGASAARAGRPPADGSCASHSNGALTITVCPGSARVGSVVEVRGDLACSGNGSTARNLSVVFLGPGDYVGSGGGGAPVHFRVETDAFEASFRVPATYPGSERAGARARPVLPGRRYAFATYPARACSVPFTVLAPRVSHARLWRPVGLSGLRCGLARGRAALLCVRRGDRLALRLAARGRTGRLHIASGQWPFGARAGARVAVVAAAGQWAGAGLRCRVSSQRVACRNRAGHGFAIGPRGSQTF